MAAAALAAALVLTPAADTALDRAAVVPASQRAFADCVAHRESRGNPKATSSLSSSAGKWQFLQSQWGQSLPWMIAARLRDYGMSAADAKATRIRLQRTPIHRWSEQHQDVGFIAVLNARGQWSGWKHWYMAGSPCNALVGAR